MPITLQVFELAAGRTTVPAIAAPGRERWAVQYVDKRSGFVLAGGSLNRVIEQGEPEGWR
ncbi:hypothetical protein [Sporomusa sp.]|uniref:hypothetical protein n=1 Tax=Sporomusa sp. TaxID=2078658 RepID=UPI002B811A1D|nr:hypothetical protein [Sporomusa sp.]HWR41990.1 hypothetical protein [Sporomusa sp.]